MAIISLNLFSQCLSRNVDVTVVIPSDKVSSEAKHAADPGSYDAGAYLCTPPYKTLYLLHGLYGDHLDWLTQTRVRRLAEAYGLCVVMPSGENKFYADSCATGDHFGRFVSEELVELTRRTLPLSSRREDTFIGGLSMGGFGAITNGLRHPEVFSHIAAFSSGLLADDIASSGEASGGRVTASQYRCMFGLDDVRDFIGSSNDYNALADGLAAADNKPRVFLSCGAKDGLYPASVAFRDRLLADGFDVAWYEGPYAHEWEFWDLSLERALEWLPLGGAEAGLSSGNIGRD